MTNVAAKKNRSLELLEESLQILRTGGASILLLYWTGALPFAISLLWLLRDTGFNWGGPLLFRYSLICAVTFIWMSYWKSAAARNTLLLLTPASTSSANWHQCAAIQAIFQTFKLFVMPFAITSLLAWPAASSFFRTLSLEPISSARPIRNGLARAFSTATMRYAENAVAFLTVAGFAIIIFLNVLITLAISPYLWKVLTGIETDWSRFQNPGVIFSLFTVAAIATWLLIDPWLQTYSVLRVFYQNARSDGRDLLRDITRLAAIILFCLMVIPAHAQTNQQKTLDNAIDHASQDVNYGWLRPAASNAEQGFLGELAQKVRDTLTWMGHQISRAYRSFMHWVDEVFRPRELPNDDGKKIKPHSQELRWTLALLAILICGAIIALFMRGVKTKGIKQTEAAAAAAPEADVLNEQLLPSEVNHEEWLRLAFQYLSNNQTRLAARAFYLANLSYLGTQSMLSLALWKSNRLYERELARQPKAAELNTAFAACNRLYERAWYGMRELGAEQIDILKGSVACLRNQ